MINPSTGVVLLDIMLGYGSHADMAGSLIPTIKELQAKADAAGKEKYSSSLQYVEQEEIIRDMMRQLTN